VVIGIVVVSLWTPLANDAVFSRWFSWPNILILSPVPVATALVAWATWRALGGASQFGGFYRRPSLARNANSPGVGAVPAEAAYAFPNRVMARAANEL